MTRYSSEIDKLKALSEAISSIQDDVGVENDRLLENDNLISTWGLQRVIAANDTVKELGLEFSVGFDSSGSVNQLENLAEYFTDHSVTERIEAGLGIIYGALDDAADILGDSLQRQSLLISKHGTLTAAVMGSDKVISTVVAHTATEAGRRKRGFDKDFEITPDEVSFVAEMINEMKIESPKLEQKASNTMKM